MKTSKLFSMIAGITASAGALVSNTDASDTYSFHNSFVGRQNFCSGNAPRVIVPEQAIHVERREGVLFPWTRETWTQQELHLRYLPGYTELQTPCGPVCAPTSVPAYVEENVTRNRFGYEWGRNVNPLIENLKPRTSHVDIYISGSCPQPICPDPCFQPRSCDPIQQFPGACNPVQQMPEPYYPPRISQPAMQTPVPPRPTPAPVNPGYQTMPGPSNAPTGNEFPRGF